MTIRAWRIVKRKHAKTAFTGEGARLNGGRWNSPGIPVVYTSSSQSLAALEMLAHLESADLLFHYVVFEVTFEAALVRDIETVLPKNWSANPTPHRVRAIGDRWLREGNSAVLRVASAIVTSEHNYLLNPRHSKIGKIKIGKLAPFRVDTRLALKLKDLRTSPWFLRDLEQCRIYRFGASLLPISLSGKRAFGYNHRKLR